jgi:hypothetical protein
MATRVGRRPAKAVAIRMIGFSATASVASERTYSSFVPSCHILKISDNPELY